MLVFCKKRVVEPAELVRFEIGVILGDERFAVLKELFAEVEICIDARKHRAVTIYQLDFRD